MERWAVDRDVAIELARAGYAPGEAVQLVGPASLRSQAASRLYREVRDGTTDRADALAVLESLTGLTMRLLGDRVSRRTAWRLAEQLDWPDPAEAEYLAVARLQADALVTADPRLLEAAARVDVPTAEPGVLLGRGSPGRATSAR